MVEIGAPQSKSAPERTLSYLADLSVKIFAKVPYPQHYYDTGCLDEESLGIDKVTD